MSPIDWKRVNRLEKLLQDLLSKAPANQAIPSNLKQGNYLLLAFTNRSGSNHAGEALSAELKLNFEYECLNEGPLKSLASGTVAKTLPKTESAFPSLIKANPEQLIALLRLNLRDELIDKPKGVVHIQRQDKVAQAISLARSLKTGAFTSSQMVTADPPKYLNWKEIWTHANAINRRNYLINQVITSFGFPHVLLTHETFLDKQDRYVRKVEQNFRLERREERIDLSLKSQSDDWNTDKREWFRTEFQRWILEGPPKDSRYQTSAKLSTRGKWFECRWGK